MVASATVSKKRAPQTNHFSLIRQLVAAVTGMSLVWTIGFAWFLYLALRESPPVPHADAIVLLTVGLDRAEVAVRLLVRGTGDRLLVSGAGDRTDLVVLSHRVGLD